MSSPSGSQSNSPNSTEEFLEPASAPRTAPEPLGGALGLAILSTVAASQTTSALKDVGGEPSGTQQASALVDGFQAAFAIGAGLMILGVILAAVLIRRKDVRMVAEAESPVIVPGA